MPAAAPTSTPGPQIPDLAPWLPSSLLPAEPDAVLAPFETNVLLDGHTPGEGRLQGIYSMDDGFYVMIDEAPYQVRHVGELDSWVVVDPQTPFSFYRQVPIRLDAEGRWRPLENGLRGGAPRFGVPPLAARTATRTAALHALRGSRALAPGTAQGRQWRRAPAPERLPVGYCRPPAKYPV
ncbi:hypothetical protein G3436_18180 [Pseudomonas sp. MAFF212427]|uniref:Uncharacterized protein n=1 Tax=Pseudomonas brassicae TaxID=2708063 RepID=A0A6B3NZ50_9PSED|nr:hypothetical protein [Pseudomonas brassicae]NER65440.1 hypothetical protein [Pseudomonas brassicae]